MDKNYCKDCHKKIGKYSIRCKSCAATLRFKNPNNHPFYGKTGKNASNFKGGDKVRECFCQDCGNKAGNWAFYEKTKSCQKCYLKTMKGNNHPSFKHGKSSIETFCVDCGQKLSIHAFYYGIERCQSCAQKKNIINHPEHIELLRKLTKIRLKDPKNHPNYKDGKSKEIYPSEFNNHSQLKESIRKRDNYECQNCSMTEEEHLIVWGQVLHIHHIDYDKQNCSEDNLITLCGGCNSRANFNQEYWQELYTNKIKMAYGR